MDSSQILSIFMDKSWLSCMMVMDMMSLDIGLQYIDRSDIDLSNIESGLLVVERDDYKTYIDINFILGFKVFEKTAANSMRDAVNPFTLR